MKEGIVVYQSKYGAAAKYAAWLGELTGFDTVKVSDAETEDLLDCSSIVLCGGIYASGIAGLSFLKKNFSRLEGKKTAVFCVGASPFDEKAIEEIKARNLKGSLSTIPLFYGRGMWDEEKMTTRDRTLCRMLQKSVAKKDPDTYEPWQKALMCAAGESRDWTDRKYLEPLMEYLKTEEEN